jgi:hypothetical protein
MRRFHTNVQLKRPTIRMRGKTVTVREEKNSRSTKEKELMQWEAWDL